MAGSFFLNMPKKKRREKVLFGEFYNAFSAGFLYNHFNIFIYMLPMHILPMNKGDTDMSKMVSNVANLPGIVDLLPENCELIPIPESYKVEELIEAAKDAEYLYIYSISPIPAEVFEQCKKLKMVHTRGVGYNYIDLDAATKAGVLVCNCGGVNAVTVSEHTIGLILNALRNISRSDHLFKSKGFKVAKQILKDGNIRELAYRHVGILGMGAIGKEVAKRLKAFGCRISYYDVFRCTPEKEEELGISFLPFDELISSCDIITLHMPVFPETKGIISREVFAAMKDGTILVNCGRGELVDQDALCDAVESGRIKACVDVFNPEPVPDDFRMVNLSEDAMDRLTLTPHFAGNGQQTAVNMGIWTMKDFKDFEAGILPARALNKSVWNHDH